MEASVHNASHSQRKIIVTAASEAERKAGHKLVLIHLQKSALSPEEELIIGLNVCLSNEGGHVYQSHTAGVAL